MNILGMDSFTFKSCALIMQDQYGLFLQAKPEERVEVLGTLLGLGVYQIMEKIAFDKAKINGAKGRELNQEVDVHNRTIAEFGSPDEELEVCRTELAGHENSLQLKIAERDKQKLILANQQAAAERRAKLLASITTLKSKKTATEQSRATQQAIIDSSAIILEGKAEIEEKVAEHNSLLKRELELAGESALYSSKKQEAENLAKQAVTEQETIDAYKARIEQKNRELSLAQPTDQDSVVKEKAELYTQKKTELDEMQEKAVVYQKAKTEHAAAVFRHDEITRKFDTEKQSADEQKRVLEKKVEILSESGCVDIDNAHCKFLQDAIEAKEELAALDEIYVDIAARRETELAKTKLEVDEKLSAMNAIEFDAEVLSTLQKECAALLPYVSQLEVIKQREGKIALLEADIKHLQSNILEAEKRLDEVKTEGMVAEKERDLYADAFSIHAKVQSEIVSLEPWLEKEKQLPVAEERNLTAKNRVLELTEELLNIDTDIAEKQEEADKDNDVLGSIEELENAVGKMDAEVDELNSLITEKQKEVGALQQKSGQITKLKKEIKGLQERQAEYARETADYGTLKDAFSQSGVPHQIIRSIIPQLTTTSNTILGQMTGGKMGVEFRLERLQKNGKEKASLDIFIEEYGKSVLPYLSKSGGEKVKSSLSVILALAEIKSSSSGIQLGMLFIDEPPFLDGDGIQAYCDALETIQVRYLDIKIMAITHDPTMKARFPQNLDVVKTEHGSKVIY